MPTVNCPESVDSLESDCSGYAQITLITARPRFSTTADYFKLAEAAKGQPPMIRLLWISQLSLNV